ncbi:alpha-(1,3)-fucosyltransferase C-like [Teleopsis dalmanni]|uniref:alpha-(1,3)-fucosyltransferase C-like n=1 Tax=Teleopsis dalmanni TaxID=139649 RepID=UPI0018CCC96E|nr:alpha-(1,3)-fucosyltransferase C-like [Teleopsis dalmanni]
MLTVDIEFKSDNEWSLVKNTEKKSEALIRRKIKRKRKIFQYIILFGILVISMIGVCALLNVLNSTAENPQLFGRTKHVLLWKSKHMFGEMASQSGDTYICERSKCIIEFSYEDNIDLNKFDAIVIDGLGKDYAIVPHRYSHQLYVGAFPPNFDPIEFTNISYDILMSYKLNSDIVWTYYEITTINSSSTFVTSTLQRNWDNAVTVNESDIEKLKIFAQNKNKLIFTFPTNSWSNYYKYLIEQFNNSISIDICTNCDFQYLSLVYKFILISPEVNCEDNVPNIFYLALKNRIVPIVYGKVDFKRFAPPRHFIKADEFSTVKEFANFLKYLDKTPDAYLQYLTFSYQYTIKANFLPMCKICNFLKNTDFEYYQNRNVSTLFRSDC